MKVRTAAKSGSTPHPDVAAETAPTETSATRTTVGCIVKKFDEAFKGREGRVGVVSCVVRVGSGCLVKTSGCT